MKLDSKSKRLLLSITLVLFGQGLAVLPATGATYTNIVVPGSLATSANGIDNLGQVVGYYELPSTEIAGFLLSGGTYTTISFSGEPNTFATAINDSGLIAGYVQTQNIGTPYFGFTYQNGKFVSRIAFPSAKSTQPFGINNAGQVVGSYVDLRNVTHGFEYSAGTYTSIDIKNAKSTIAAGINNSGDISGTYVDQSAQQHGFLLHKNGSVTVINYKGAGTGTTVGGINDNDQIAGYFTPVASDQRTGFEWNNGTFIPIVHPATDMTQPYAINNNQVVVGAWLSSTGTEGFMETP